MKTLLLGTSVAALFLSACAKGPDMPPPKFSSQTQAAYDLYLSGKLGPPTVFIVSEDGDSFYWSYCPIHADGCRPGSQAGATLSKLIDLCEQDGDTPCHVYARGKRVVCN
jgi:hypothetical protein